MNQQRKYRMFAFVLILKNYRGNSIILSTETRNYMSKKLGMSFTTYSIIFQECINIGLIIPSGKNYQVIGLINAISLLGLEDFITKHDNFYNRATFEFKTYKQVYENIVKMIALHNYKMQAWNIERKEIIFSKNKEDRYKRLQAIKRCCKEAAKNGIATDDYINNLKINRKNNIVSGKFHLGNILGYSSSSGSNWLKKMHNDNTINRRVNTFLIKGNHDAVSYGYLIEDNKNVKIIPTSIGYVGYLGSVITMVKK